MEPTAKPRPQAQSSPSAQIKQVPPQTPIEPFPSLPASDDGGEGPEIDEPAEGADVLEFKHPKRSNGRGRKRLAERYRMDYVKASRNTWAFRIRPRDDSFPPVVIRRVTDKTFKEITRSKKRYEKFQTAQINQFKQRAIRADLGRVADADRTL